MAVQYQQDPHKTAEFGESDLQSAVGRQVRQLRRSKGLTITQLAADAHLSSGMLSKLENGQTAPSLGTLKALSQALGVPITTLFKGYEETREAMHVKAGDGIIAARAGTRAGHQYNLLGSISGSSSVTVEPYLIELTETSDTFPTFQHEGLEFLYMLEGRVGYRHGKALYDLEPGDSLFFDADAPHGPEKLRALPARYLSIICYPQEN
ncbi:Transcriptional regulator, MerR family [Candidatus Rhodobacter oscarellae]|uniref:Transcriptional regulator, MerR family n=1 Tax=Candidatus Rhodobacter oscarellae TaxID=1675527 RepID=A0A0J9EBF6_9RHOB|nr:XRE family transcriptional regulator [Candidatus Rhodobacter lobularis]KMW59981.1 Transcriptional regulator, MerR family [Candidatus Rhodobacter lobularis]